nr:DASS family sodium-coupled anion symporter [Actinomyces lilanjuaniae]
MVVNLVVEEEDQMPQVRTRPARPARQDRRPPLGRKERIGLVLAVVVFLAPLLVDVPDLDPVGERMLSVFLLAIVLWVTEAIPLVATAVLVIGLEILLVSDQALLAVPEDSPEYSSFLEALANPVIILFLGGFLIADGAAKYHLDRNLAAVLIRPFTGSARTTVLGLMVITALLSMFMSNTATTATMFAVLIPILGALPQGRPRAGVALSIPVAANVGGIGTPVGTPPNAIALGALAEAGYHISFAQWMLMAVPLMLVILLAAWLLLIILFIPRGLGIDLDMTASWDTDRKAVIFYAIAAATIILWMTENLHGLSANVVGFLAVVALLVTQVMDGSDLGRLSWPVLWLVAGGIALGDGVGSTGLDAWILGLFRWESMGALVVLIVMGLLGLVMSNVISHSAASNLLIPLAMGLATGIGGLDPVTIAVVLALACSLGMSLPISTPPNAIAYATGEVSTADMARTGIIVGLVGTVVLVLVMPTFWSLMGLL